ncbi:hypothetical protein F8M41_019434 [Gigaspora margarita]|uniref:Uncharacterized protein n=1 Tax=Gigaspora margarita TaxID=4874 RepID=A0A8H4EKN4_GIGMA|nr:hypothetical protein F8M41_019434 [Gigaspora margarita]
MCVRSSFSFLLDSLSLCLSGSLRIFDSSGGSSSDESELSIICCLFRFEGTVAQFGVDLFCNDTQTFSSSEFVMHLYPPQFSSALFLFISNACSIYLFTSLGIIGVVSIGLTLQGCHQFLLIYHKTVHRIHYDFVK